EERARARLAAPLPPGRRGRPGGRGGGVGVVRLRPARPSAWWLLMTRQSLQVLVGAALLAAAPAAPGLAAGEGPPSVWTAEQLREGILQNWRRLRSVHVVYRTPYDQTLVRAPEPNAYLQVIVAAKPPCSFFFDVAHGSDYRHWTADPVRRRIYYTP